MPELLSPAVHTTRCFPSESRLRQTTRESRRVAECMSSAVVQLNALTMRELVAEVDLS